MSKVLIIGLDGTTWKVIKPWIDGGYLPTFKKLIEDGTWGILKSTIPCLSSPAIPSFFTGKNPAKLGFFDFIKPDGSLVSYNDIKEPAIWDILGEYGYKSMIINLRMTYPPKKINGIMISGLPPSEDSEYTYPPDLKNKVKGFHLENEELKKLWKEKIFDERLFSLYVQRMWRRYKIFKNLTKERKYDFIIYWIEETDSIQHWYWNYKDIILDFFKEVDKILSDIIKNFQNMEIFIISDHGFHGPAIYEFNVNSWLLDQGYLKLKGNRLRQWLTYKAYSFAKYRVGRILLKHFKSLKYNINKLVNKLILDNWYEKSLTQKKENIYFPWGVNHNDTIAIAYGANPLGIKIIKKNLRQDQDYEKIREEIISKLKHLNKDGKRVLENVWKREEVFDGRYISHIPDIVYLASEYFNTTTSLSKNIFNKRKETKIIGRHEKAREGIFIAYGHDIKKGKKLGEIEITDIAPTVLHLFDIPIPKDMDGRVLKDIFNGDSKYAKMPIKYQEYTEKERIRRKIRELKTLEKLNKK
jgi:predicted AlkP superfamily phosphohydrolase/phosphomutase